MSKQRRKDAILGTIAAVAAATTLQEDKIVQEGSMEIEILGEKILVPKDIREHEIKELFQEKIDRDANKILELYKHRGMKLYEFEPGVFFPGGTKKAARKKYDIWKSNQKTT